MRVAIGLMIGGAVLFVDYHAAVVRPGAELSDRLDLVRTVPVSAEADLIESGTDGSLFCISPSREGTRAFSVWRYPDVTSACADTKRLGDTWADAGSVTYLDPCGWSGSVAGREVSVSVDTQGSPPLVYVNA